MLRTCFQNTDNDGNGIVSKNEYIGALRGIFENYSFDKRGIHSKLIWNWWKYSNINKFIRYQIIILRMLKPCLFLLFSMYPLSIRSSISSSSNSLSIWNLYMCWTAYLLKYWRILRHNTAYFSVNSGRQNMFLISSSLGNHIPCLF